MYEILSPTTSDEPISDQPFKRHPFPVLDFMFRNSGNGTALLTRYRIEVQNAEIDTTPHLMFDWALRSGGDVPPKWGAGVGDCLDIVGRNMGRGSAKDVNIELLSEAPRDMFGSGPFYAPEISDDSPVTIASLKAMEKNQNMFQKHAVTLEELVAAAGDIGHPLRRLPYLLTYHEFEQLYSNPEFAQHPYAFVVDRLLERDSDVANFITLNPKFVPLESIPFNLICIDVKGQPWRGKEYLEIDPGRGNIWVGENSFLYLHGPMPLGAMGPPGPMFCVIIEPERHKYIQEYNISRLIEAGDVERFQVLIGATKSCKVDLRVAFVVDGTQEVRSAPFHFQIKNRRDQQFHLDYRDGQEILESVIEKQEKQARSRSW